MRILGTATAFACLLSLGAAATGPPAAAQTNVPAGLERAFDRIDRNSDGVISREEWALRDADLTPWEELFGLHHSSTARPAISLSEYFGGDPAFDRADRNRDGAVARQEFLTYAAAAVDDARARTARLDSPAFDRGDRDADGFVSRKEWALREAELTPWEELFGPHHSSTDRPGISLSEDIGGDPTFEALDANGDSRISREEFLGYADRRREGPVVQVDRQTEWERLFGPNSSSGDRHR